jgi:hypothetical protein
MSSQADAYQKLAQEQEHAEKYQASFINYNEAINKYMTLIKDTQDEKSKKIYTEKAKALIN